METGSPDLSAGSSLRRPDQSNEFGESASGVSQVDHVMRSMRHARRFLTSARNALRSRSAWPFSVVSQP